MLALPSSYDSLEQYTDHLCGFIATPLVRQITGGIHVNDALIHDAWQKLPQEWTAWWSSWPDHRLAQQDLIDALGHDAGRPGPDTDVRDREPRPIADRPGSLTEWLNTMRRLALPRARRRGPRIHVPETLARRMKTKKSAEVSSAAAHVHAICQRKGITRIIDMGSGRGYLSLSLAYLFPHLRILSIDASQSQISGSRSLAAELGIPESRLRTMVRWIDGSPALAAEIEEWAGGEKCMLVGLHACGSLTETMLRCFAGVACIDAVAVVGCCYNHMVPRSPSHPAGFPISSALRRRGVTLSPTALMTACQSPSNWKRPDTRTGPGPGPGPGDESSVFSKRRLYRVILEKMFDDKGVRVGTLDGDRPVWGTRKGDVASFAAFAHRAMDRLGVERDKITAAELAAYERRYGHCQGQIAILWTLSVLCCNVVESVIAMDRFWFLGEEGAQGVDIVPIFDAKVSPRNLMLVAEKRVTGSAHISAELS